VRVFLSKAALFLLPLIIFTALMAVIDPFERFNVWTFAPVATKKKIAMVVNPVLWKVIEIERNPAPDITLGASKMAALTPDMLRDVTGYRFRDLSLGGGSANEMINLFWLSAKNAPLQHVIVGINVQDFNYFNDRDRVTGAIATADNPLMYLINRDTLAAAWDLVRMKFFGAPAPSTAPQMSKEAFWRLQVGEGAERNFLNYRFDEGAFERFGEVALYCRQHGVDLMFIILPSHADIHQRIRQLGATVPWMQMPAKIALLGETHDYDVDNATTMDQGNFSDPFHFSHEVARRLVEDAWNSRPRERQ
jgi:hypothetical protein